MIEKVVSFIKELYGGSGFIPLHAPFFSGNEKTYLSDCIDSTYVSYVGKYVTRFEEMTASYTGTKNAVAVSSGTTALQVALQLAGVTHETEVITQPLTFVATANAIVHAGGVPVFIDVDCDTLGMSPSKLSEYLETNCIKNEQGCFNKYSKRKVSAILPVHIFGHACRIEEIIEIARYYNIPVVEDAAEALGSFYKGKHLGTFGLLGILSYNGNKTITTGGGGMILTDDQMLAERARHITTTAKVPHQWEYIHDEAGYNFRLTNVNAALGTAQMEYLEKILANKRQTASLYDTFFAGTDFSFITEPVNAKSNYWLNAVLLKNKEERDKFLRYSVEQNVMTRPAWCLLNKLRMYETCLKGNLENALQLEERIVNIPSGYRSYEKN